jgi:hypothetical protein
LTTVLHAALAAASGARIVEFQLHSLQPAARLRAVEDGYTRAA